MYFMGRVLQKFPFQLLLMPCEQIWLEHGQLNSSVITDQYIYRHTHRHTHTHYTSPDIPNALFRTAVETAISGIQKLLRTGGVPTSLTLFFWRWLTISSVFAGRSGWTSYWCLPLLLLHPFVPNKPYSFCGRAVDVFPSCLLSPFPPSLTSRIVSADVKHHDYLLPQQYRNLHLLLVQYLRCLLCAFRQWEALCSVQVSYCIMTIIINHHLRGALPCPDPSSASSWKWLTLASFVLSGWRRCPATPGSLSGLRSCTLNKQTRIILLISVIAELQSRVIRYHEKANSRVT